MNTTNKENRMNENQESKIRPESLREHGLTEAELLVGYAQCAGGVA